MKFMMQNFKRLNFEHSIVNSKGIDYMADEGTASTLVLVAGIIQLIIMFIIAGLTGLLAMMIPLILTLTPSELPPELTMADLQLVVNLLGIVVSVLVVITILTLIFSILWLMWRKDPIKHRAGLIVTGILGLIFGGVLPGLLALIGGAIAKPEPEYKPPTFPKTPVTTPAEPTVKAAAVKYCPACGNPIANPNAEFCGVCGASLT